MSRVDVPTLMCDRCKFCKSDLGTMGEFHKVWHPNGPGYDAQEWDLCPDCWESFRTWLAGDDQ